MPAALGERQGKNFRQPGPDPGHPTAPIPKGRRKPLARYALRSRLHFAAAVSRSHQSDRMRGGSVGVGRYVPGRLLRPGVALALFLAASALPAAAHGNVSATVDAVGDLWLFGDGLSNGLRVDSGGDDEDVFRIRGIDDSTTVNGLAEVTLVAPGTRMVVFLGDGDNEALFGDGYGSSPSCCRRELLVVSGAGADRIVLVGPFERVTADLGPGDDSLEVTEGSLGVSGTLVLGAGDDVLAISAFTAARGSFDLGPGSDQLVVGEDTTVDGTIELGPGDDFLWMTEDAGDVELRGGDGNDTFELERFGAGA